MYYSYEGQDRWVLETLGFKRDGIFLDLGAGDGITGNNTYALEKDYGWTGACAENHPERFSLLEQNRSASKYNYMVHDDFDTCLIDEEGKEITDPNGTGYTANCITIGEILVREGLVNGLVDYMSLNVGGNEFEALGTIDFTKTQIALISVQHNKYKTYYNGIDNIFYLLNSNGFERMHLDVCGQNPFREKSINQPYEDWYYNKSLITHP